MARQWWLILVVAAAAFVAAACQTSAEPTVSTGPSTGYQNLSPQQFKALLDREDPFLLDVHVPNQGYLQGTDARIPYTDVAKRSGELPADKNTTIALYCMSGRMSAIAADELARLGYRNVRNLDGGLAAWQAAGYQVQPE